MNPLNSITGTIVAGFVLALILGLAVNAATRTGNPSSASAPVNKLNTG